MCEDRVCGECSLKFWTGEAKICRTSFNFQSVETRFLRIVPESLIQWDGVCGIVFWHYEFVKTVFAENVLCNSQLVNAGFAEHRAIINQGLNPGFAVSSGVASGIFSSVVVSTNSELRGTCYTTDRYRVFPDWSGSQCLPPVFTWSAQQFQKTATSSFWEVVFGLLILSPSLSCPRSLSHVLS